MTPVLDPFMADVKPQGLQIVEGVVHDSPSPSTLSPVDTPPSAAGEGADVSSGTTPSPARPGDGDQ